ncbi:unnamed protein product [Linum tenue]|uniref:rhamnogalacturonan endolyase n=1 Tax=Linum tenue TaxID=586396 RepID=A0AAV0J8V5_9ROSI|nr:unnamed protein product [Linum tenue]
MEKRAGRQYRCSAWRRRNLPILFLFFFFFFLVFSGAASAAGNGKTHARRINPGRNSSRSNSGFGVQLVRRGDPQRVTIDNGIVAVTFSSPDGDVIGIKYKGIDNVLETLNDDDNRGYWDVVWSKPGDQRGPFDKLRATDFRVVMQDDEQIEVSFTKKWEPSDATVPLNIDKRYILRRGSSGIYMYAVLERLEGWPDVDMDQIRVVFKLQQKLFHFMAISDDRQRVMPLAKDRITGRPLAYPEAVLLTHPSNPEFRGEVDDKYQYSCEDKDNKVHGWISEEPAVGFWMITPSDEFRVGGPIKQDLTSHVDSVSVLYKMNHSELLHLVIRYINERLMYAGSAYVGLAIPGDVGSWQRDAKGYQFWTQADRKGRFFIDNIRVGTYNLYAWVPGIMGDYKYSVNITIQPGSKMDLGMLVYDPPRNGPTLWEIGIPDRTAAEFHVPEAYPTLMNKLYTNHPTDSFRQYGLWSRYTDTYPRQDLVYDVGVSNFFEDWFFAHVVRSAGNNTFRATTWRINFDLPTVDKSKGDYTFQLALASAAEAELHVRFNDLNAPEPLFSTGLIGKDNAIARHGIHGLYWLYSISVPNNQLVDGRNSIYLTQTRTHGAFYGVMYDYIRLEGPRGT